MWQRAVFARRFMGLALAVSLVALNGCWLAEAAERAKGKSMLAQYTGLDNKSLAIVVFPDMATTNEFPAARQEISAFVETQLKLHMKNTRLLDSKEVIRWQDETINWFALSPVDIGKRFDVDRVLFIELRTYEAKSSRSYGDLQGRVEATCSIYEVDADRGVPGWRGDVKAQWPMDAPLPSWRSNEQFVRQQALEQFADKLVKCFYDWQDYGTRIRDRG